MRKALWLLSGLLLLAGCGGIQNRVHLDFISTPSAQLIQEIHFPSIVPDLGSRESPGAAAPTLRNPVPETPTPLPPSKTSLLRPGGDQASSSPAAPAPPKLPPEPKKALGETTFCHPDGTSAVIYALGERPPSWPAIEFRGGMKTGGAGGVQEPQGLPAAAQVSLLRPGPEKFPAPPPAPASAEKKPESADPIRPGGTDFLGELSPPAGMDYLLGLLEETPRRISAGLEGEVLSPPAAPVDEVRKESPPETQDPSKLLDGIPARLNEKVKDFLLFFQNKADGFYTKSLARSMAYEGMMKKILREKNLPEDLFYLALIESGYNPHALSRAKASGIWQFMSYTAKRFGLKVDKWVDERRDPEKSTHAAAEYLKSLYEMFNCWYLATASYNAGEGKMLQAIKKAKSQDFGEIAQHRFLKRETKEYVPMFLAATIIAQDPKKYGFSNIDYHAPLVYEKVNVPPGYRLDRIARAAETDLAEIKALNPSLKRDVTPPYGNSFVINLPPGKKEVFEKNFLKMNKLDPRTAKKHQVRSGETLGQIARKHQVSLEELCESNQITLKTIIRPGLILLLP